MSIVLMGRSLGVFAIFTTSNLILANMYVLARLYKHVNGSQDICVLSLPY